MVVVLSQRPKLEMEATLRYVGGRHLLGRVGESPTLAQDVFRVPYWCVFARVFAFHKPINTAAVVLCQNTGPWWH